MLKFLATFTTMLLLVVSTAAAGPVPEKTETVIVTGVGITADAARQNAVRNAVEQVVGTYIKSETAVSNSALIKDEILSHSGGYAKETKVLSANKTEDGLVSVQLQATIISTKLVRKLNELNIATKTVDDGLFAKALSKLDTDRSKNEESVAGKALLDDVVKKFPSQAYRISIGEVSVESVSDATKTATVRIPLKITWDHDFVGELMQTMKQTSKFSSDFEDLIAVNKRFRQEPSNDQFEQLYCFTEKSALADLTPEYCGVVSSPSSASDRSSSIYQFMKLTRGGHNVPVKVRLTYKAADGRKLKVTYNELKSDNYKQQGLDKVRLKKIGSTSSLTFTPPSGNVPNAIAGPYAEMILVDGEYNMNVEDNLPMAQLQKVKSIEAIMEQLKD